MTVFHNLCRDYHEITAPPLDCARSGFLHTICSVVTKEKISSLRLRLLSQQYLAKFSHRQVDRAAVSPTTLAALAPASHTSSTSVRRFHACKLHRFHQRLQVFCFCKSHQFHQDSTQWSRSWISSILFELVSFDVSTQHSCRSPSADCSHLKWKSQMVLLTTPSGSR